MKFIIAASAVILLSATLSHANEAAGIVESASAQNMPIVANTVPAAVSELSQHGKRFEKALEQIVKLRSQPSWGWEDSCDHVANNTASSVNW